MAVELAVNPSPVAKAYQELEREGFLTSEEGSGIFVAAEVSSRLGQREFGPEFDQLCQDFLAQAARWGYSTADVVAALSALLEGKTGP